MVRVPLATIAALARSGALDRAQALFDAGYGAGDSAAELALKGRILKGLAMRAGQVGRAALLAGAEDAYVGADRLAPQPYLLINAATLAALRGDDDRAAAMAREVLVRLDADDLAETPYYIAATRSEAALLLGDLKGAERLLHDAIALHPAGWEQHASTLRQFAAILAVRGNDAAWLDACRPPASLHFVGHLGIAADASDGLRHEVDALLAERRIGFGFGALAAGVDIVVAEALLARGAELHAVLPAAVEDFAIASVAPFGDAWLGRYRACLARATSVRCVADAGRTHDPQATALASEVAMGAAALDARLHESRGVQLIVADDGEGDFGSGRNSARDGALWRSGGSEQYVLRWPRSATIPPSITDHARPGQHVAAVLLIAPGEAAVSEAAVTRWIDAGVLPIRTALGAANRGLTADAALVAGFDTPVAAAQAVRRIAALDLAEPPRIAGVYGIVHRVGEQLVGLPVAMAQRMLDVALPGMTVVTDLFAQAAAIHDAAMVAEPIGLHDLASQVDPVPLFALPD